jgi:hypothetical protein
MVNNSYGVSKKLISMFKIYWMEKRDGQNGWMGLMRWNDACT